MKERTKNFQGLRVLFLLGIVFMHANLTFIGEGWLLCTFFFVLSGFLYKHPENTAVYVKKKILKTFPLYWLCLLLYVVLCHPNISIDILPHIFLLQSYIPSSAANAFYYKYLGVSWFLSSLLFCYIVSPFLYKLLERLKQEHTFLILMMLVIFMYIIRSCKLLPKEYGIWFYYISPFYRIFEYTAGMLLAKTIKDKPIAGKMRFQECISILIIIGMIVFLRHGMHVQFVTALFLFIIYYLYTYKSVIMDAIFGNKVVIWIARYGMALYLGHQFLYVYFFKILQLHRAPSILLAIIISIAIGWLYSLIVTKANKK
ncbi:MAG: acyltransferase family protein [Bacteroidales bacterium]|nr:acyltransferase family protein [Bacteroidales bacterium]